MKINNIDNIQKIRQSSLPFFWPIIEDLAVAYTFAFFSLCLLNSMSILDITSKLLTIIPWVTDFVVLVFRYAESSLRYSDWAVELS